MQKHREKRFSKCMAVVLAVVMTIVLIPAAALGADNGLSEDIVILFTGDVDIRAAYHEQIANRIQSKYNNRLYKMKLNQVFR